MCVCVCVCAHVRVCGLLFLENNYFVYFSIHQVKVVDRTAITTANAETEVVSPAGLQNAINSEIGKLIL